jgi:gamma-glutamylcyclotransferase (GGCT)/AIG2-like uncharacterized protein YtfP
MDLFVYGTLMVPEIMSAVCGYEREGTPARIDGYRRRRVSGESYPGITQSSGDTVTGLLYRDVSLQQFSILDDFEGAMYRRSAVCAITGDGSCDALAYVLDDHCKALLTDEQWSLEAFVNSHLNAFMTDYEGFVMLR